MKIRCKYCRSELKFFLTSYDHNRKYTKYKFNYYKCTGCNTITLTNFPKKISSVYKNSYYSVKNKNQILKDNINRIQYLQNLNLKKKSDILEIGSGPGEFLYCAKKLGFNPVGLDINPKLSNFTKKNYDIETITNKKISSIKKKYSLIVSWHSLEHFEHPFDVLLSITKIVKKNGFVILSLPNPKSFGFKMLKSKWPHLDAPRHRNLIDIKTIQNFFENKKFKTLLTTTNDKDSKYNNRLSYSIFLYNILFSKSFFEANKIEKFVFNLMGLFVSIFFYPIENSRNNGSTFNIVLKKK
tara:strand:+ start:1452 stop:2342 length:891 start_codon:yes stop_codon:yes gene_type:complete